MNTEMGSSDSTNADAKNDVGGFEDRVDVLSHGQL